MKKKAKSTKSGARLPVQLGFHLDIPAKTTPVDLVFVKVLDRPEWDDTTHKTAQLGNWVNWGIGACIVKGEEWFGEEYVQTISDAGISPDRATACKYVYERIPVAMRIKELSWSHHREVAPLEKERDRAVWLAKALKNDWSVAELKLELEDAGLRNHKPKPVADPGYESESSGGGEQQACACCGENPGTVKICSHCFSETALRS